MNPALLFSLQSLPLGHSLHELLPATAGEIERRRFPDGESYLRVLSDVQGRNCIVLHSLANPDADFLPLLFLLDTLRELGAQQVGLVAPYLAYMRQDCRFQPGEAITSKLFARALAEHIDWLVTVDPHLHRYRSLAEIYPVPTRVVHAAPALADWLADRDDLLLVGPDSESEQWVADIAARGGHPRVVCSKVRRGDRDVVITLPGLAQHGGRHAVIVDDVLSSGETVRQCALALGSQGFDSIECAAVHPILSADAADRLHDAGIGTITSCNTIAHSSNAIDVAPLLVQPLQQLLQSRELS